jgi:hypothetical protein
LLEWVAAVAVIVGSAAVLWAVRVFDAIPAGRRYPKAVPRRQTPAHARKAA